MLEAPVMEEDHGSGGPKGKEGRVEVLPQPELPGGGSRVEEGQEDVLSHEEGRGEEGRDGRPENEDGGACLQRVLARWHRCPSSTCFAFIRFRLTRCA